MSSLGYMLLDTGIRTFVSSVYLSTLFVKMNGASKSSSKRIVLDFKQKQKIIQEYDELVKRQGKVNKTKFAEKYGLSTILEARTGR